MKEDKWLKATHPVTLLEMLRKNSDRKLRLFAAFCENSQTESWDELQTASEVAERFADGLASLKELETAYYPIFQIYALDVVSSGFRHAMHHCDKSHSFEMLAFLASFLRDIFGNPFRPVTFDPAWRTATAVGVAETIYADRTFDNLPVLADALQDAGCDHPDILTHLRGPGPHVRGCWALDLVLGKE